MPTIHEVRIRKQGDQYNVHGGGFSSIQTQSCARAKEIAGARKRVLIKRALKQVGISKMPRTLTKGRR